MDDKQVDREKDNKGTKMIDRLAGGDIPIKV